MDERTESADELLDAVGAAFSRLRRRTNHRLGERGATRKDLTRNLVINIIDEGPGEITVGVVADQLNVDPSVASRMVADCIDARFIERTVSQADGRRAVLRLTAEGIALRDRFRRLQRESFEEATSGWTDRDRLEFARLLIRYASVSSTQTERVNAGPRTDHTNGGVANS